MGKVDRSPLFIKAFNEAFAEESLLDKVLHVFTLLYMMFVLVLPAKLGLRKSPHKVQRVNEDVLVVQHMNSTNATCIRNKEGSILVMGTPPKRYASEIQEQLNGKIEAVFLYDASHETFASEFVDEITALNKRKPVIITPAAQRHLVDEAVHVDQDAEGSAILKSFGLIKICSSPNATRVQYGGTDAIYIFNIAGRTLAAGSCMYGNLHATISNVLTGLSGERLFRIYRMSFVKNINLVRNTWAEARDMKPDIFIPQHEDVVISNAAAEMGNWSIK